MGGCHHYQHYQHLHTDPTHATNQKNNLMPPPPPNHNTTPRHKQRRSFISSRGPWASARTAAASWGTWATARRRGAARQVGLAVLFVWVWGRVDRCMWASMDSCDFFKMKRTHAGLCYTKLEQGAPSFGACCFDEDGMTRSVIDQTHTAATQTSYTNKNQIHRRLQRRPAHWVLRSTAGLAQAHLQARARGAGRGPFG